MTLSSGGEAYFMRKVEKGKENEVEDKIEDKYSSENESPVVVHLENVDGEGNADLEAIASDHLQFMEEAFNDPSAIEQTEMRSQTEVV